MQNPLTHLEIETKVRHNKQQESSGQSLINPQTSSWVPVAPLN